MPESQPSRGSSLLSRTPSYLVSATGCRIAPLYVIFNRSLLVVDKPLHRELEAWLCTFLSWSAARGLVHSNIRPQGILGLHETLRTGGVRARELGRIHAMGLSVRPLRDPELTTGRKSCIVSNDSAGTTDGEQRWWNERLPPRSGMRFTSGPHHGFFNRHKTPSLLSGGWWCVRSRPMNSNRYTE